MEKRKLLWTNLETFSSREFVCGYCNMQVAQDRGYSSNYRRLVNGSLITKFSGNIIIICPYCSSPTYFNDEDQNPGPKYGNAVQDVPVEINTLYDEARDCTRIFAYTSAVMICRKILMNVAVSKGAKNSLSFFDYVDYLDNGNYIPPDGKDWVNHIREKGNEANHEIKLQSKESAEDLIFFIEMILKFCFEVPNRLKNRRSEQAD